MDGKTSRSASGDRRFSAHHETGWSFGENWLHVLVLKGGTQVAARPIAEVTKGRFEGVLLVAMVVLVQIAWGASLVYLAVHFL